MRVIWEIKNFFDVNSDQLTYRVVFREAIVNKWNSGRFHFVIFLLQISDIIIYTYIFVIILNLETKIQIIKLNSYKSSNHCMHRFNESPN